MKGAYLILVKGGGGKACHMGVWRRAMLKAHSFRAILRAGILAAAAAATGVAAAPAKNADFRTAPALGADLETRAATDLVLCLALLGQGDFARGESRCSAAIALNPKDSHAYKLRGYAFLLEQRFERAGEDFREALRLGQQDGETWAGYARSFSGQGQFEKALAPYQKAIALEPGKAAYWTALCWAEAGAGRHLDKALGECNRALTLAPGSAGALDARGMTYLRMGRHAEALKDYDRSLKAGGTLPSVLFGRGLAHMRLSQAAAAKADFDQARAIDPEIDLLFVQLSLVPQHCLEVPRGRDCPSGDAAPPPKNTKSPGMIARNHSGDDIERIFVDNLAGASRQARSR